MTLILSLFQAPVRAAALNFQVAQSTKPLHPSGTNQIAPVQTIAPPVAQSVAQPVVPRNAALRFGPNKPTTPPLADSTTISTGDSPSDAAPYPLSQLFIGEMASLVAKAVGSAEGTRTPSGEYTTAYYGHVDPGNGVWNLGSFSYQHGAADPEQADRKQLRRLQQQAADLRHQAQAKSINLSLLEELNGIDLANQAPLAALDRGYITWLHVAKQRPMGMAERIVWARTKSFLDPDTGYWDAPGLGNRWDAIYRDQLRRYHAIEQALAAHQP